MGKNSKDVYGADGKTNALTFDPDKLVLVTDKNHPLYDERVHLPVNENMVLNIMHQGVLQSIVICKDPESGETLVVAGRQRVKNAREANKRLRAQGCEPIMVPAMVRRATNMADMAGIMISENEAREDDTPVGRAHKMQRLLDMGKTHDHLAVIFCCSVPTVRNTLALLDTTAAVRNAVQAGDINVGQARALAKLEPAEQREKVKELVKAGEGLPAHQKARAQREVIKPASRPSMRTRKEVAEAHEAATGVRKNVLSWVLGETDSWEG